MSGYETSPIRRANIEIMENQQVQPFFRWSLEFKVLDGSPVDLTDSSIVVTDKEAQGFFKPLALLNLDIIGDFEKNFSDHVACLCKVGLGMWLKILSPSRSFLRVYLTRERLTGEYGVPDPAEEPLIYIFKPIFKDDEQAHDSIAPVKSVSRTELDIRGMLDLEFDLLDAASEAVQSAKCGGNWRNVKAADVMQAVFANVCNQYEFESEPLITGQFIAKDTNETKHSHITIDSNTDLVNLPLILQNNHGGIWPTGINRFLLDGVWYFYPPYDTTRVNKESKTFTAYITPETGSSFSSRTYYEDGEHLKLIATGAVNFKDITQLSFLSAGSGLRFTEASPVALDWTETKDNKAVAKRAQFNTEAKVYDPTKTDHRIFQGNKRFSDNTYSQMSLLAARRGILVTVEWRYSDHTLLTPGMPGRVFYDEQGQLKELQAVLVNRQLVVQTTQQGISEPFFVNTCALTFFCNIDDQEQ